ncbi:MAG: beta-ketoacyl-ACP synthase II [Candidatus Eremiobacteraeota bacterium]|nr:beta-ketoacyl-ACP synthase II [Candidatus Eremiobacteraeota bacterium]
MSRTPRIVVTGIGCLSPIGHGVDNFWQALLDGKNGIGKITSFDASDLSTQIAAEIHDFNPDDYMNKKEAKRMDRVLQFAVAAAKLALDDSGLTIDEKNCYDVGVSIGSGIGGMRTFEIQHQALLEGGSRKVSPFFIPMMIPNMCAGQVSLQFGIKGPSFSVVSACATGVNGVTSAMDALLTGRAKVMLAGGSESSICAVAMAGFCAMRAMSSRNDEPEKASRPFDKERDGFVMGEGAGVLVLETLEHATERGAKIYAELVGYGCTNDAHHITNPDGKGAAEAMRIALRDAGLKPEDIDYINAHATSTPVGDPMETAAIREVFDGHVDKMAVSSTKSMIGHTLGATGALETICCVLAVQNDVVPPTINYEFPDPECPIDCVPNLARRMTVRAALNNSFGFGGHNAVVVVKKFSQN